MNERPLSGRGHRLLDGNRDHLRRLIRCAPAIPTGQRRVIPKPRHRARRLMDSRRLLSGAREYYRLHYQLAAPSMGPAGRAPSGGTSCRHLPAPWCDSAGFNGCAAGVRENAAGGRYVSGGAGTAVGAAPASISVFAPSQCGEFFRPPGDRSVRRRGEEAADFLAAPRCRRLGFVWRRLLFDRSSSGFDQESEIFPSHRNRRR